MRNGDGDGRLANASWADDAHEAAHGELLRYGSNGFISTDHPCQSRRQSPRLPAASDSFGLSRRLLRARDRRHKAITTAGNIRYVATPILSTQRFSQGRNLNAE